MSRDQNICKWKQLHCEFSFTETHHHIRWSWRAEGGPRLSVPPQTRPVGCVLFLLLLFFANSRLSHSLQVSCAWLYSYSKYSSLLSFCLIGLVWSALWDIGRCSDVIGHHKVWQPGPKWLIERERERVLRRDRGRERGHRCGTLIGV